MKITTWEYKSCLDKPDEVEQLGRQGWEAVGGVLNSGVVRILFKRPTGYLILVPSEPQSRHG